MYVEYMQYNITKYYLISPPNPSLTEVNITRIQKVQELLHQPLVN